MIEHVPGWWDKHQAAKAWGLSVSFAAQIMKRCSKVKVATIGGRATLLVPEGTPKPTQNKGQIY